MADNILGFKFPQNVKTSLL